MKRRTCTCDRRSGKGPRCACRSRCTGPSASARGRCPAASDAPARTVIRKPSDYNLVGLALSASLVGQREAASGLPGQGGLHPSEGPWRAPPCHRGSRKERACLGEDGVNHAEIQGHVPDALLAHGTLIRVPRQVLKARQVQEVPTRQLLHRLHATRDRRADMSTLPGRFSRGNGGDRGQTRRAGLTWEDSKRSSWHTGQSESSAFSRHR